MRLPLHVDLASGPEERVGGDVELRVRRQSGQSDGSQGFSRLSSYLYQARRSL
jgi:hypothetical protein